MTNEDESQAGWWLLGIGAAIGIGAAVYYSQQQQYKPGLRDCCVAKIGIRKDDAIQLIESLKEQEILRGILYLSAISAINTCSGVQHQDDMYSMDIQCRYSTEYASDVYDVTVCNLYPTTIESPLCQQWTPRQEPYGPAKTQSQRAATHYARYGTTQIPPRQYRNMR